jgi:hypothetical protein
MDDHGHTRAGKENKARNLVGVLESTHNVEHGRSVRTWAHVQYRVRNSRALAALIRCLPTGTSRNRGDAGKRKEISPISRSCHGCAATDLRDRDDRILSFSRGAARPGSSPPARPSTSLISSSRPLAVRRRAPPLGLLGAHGFLCSQAATDSADHPSAPAPRVHLLCAPNA